MARSRILALEYALERSSELPALWGLAERSSCERSPALIHSLPEQSPSTERTCISKRRATQLRPESSLCPKTEKARGSFSITRLQQISRSEIMTDLLRAVG